MSFESVGHKIGLSELKTEDVFGLAVPTHVPCAFLILLLCFFYLLAANHLQGLTLPVCQGQSNKNYLEFSQKVTKMENKIHVCHNLELAVFY